MVKMVEQRQKAEGQWTRVNLHGGEVFILSPSVRGSLVGWLFLGNITWSSKSKIPAAPGLDNSTVVNTPSNTWNKKEIWTFESKVSEVRK